MAQRYRRIDGYKRGEPDVAWWRTAIAAGKQWRREIARESEWKTWRGYYRGKYAGVNRTIMPVNVFYRMVRTMIPRVYFRNPSISVQAAKPGLEQQLFAQAIERIDNKLIRTMDVKGQIKKMIQNAWFFGTAAGELGFGAEHTPTPDLNETDAPTEVHSKFKRRVEFNQLVQPNMPWFMSVHPGSLIVPKNLATYEETPWVAIQFRRNVWDLKADDRFENTENLRGRNDISKADANPDDIELYKIRDMRTGKVIVIPAFSSGGNTPGEEKPLLYEDDALQVNNRPNIYPLIFNPDDECFWGLADSAVLEPLQLELNETRSMQMRHRRLSLLKILYKRGAIELSELDRLLDGEVGAAIAINSDHELTDIDFKDVANMPEGLMVSDSIIQQDVRDSMGFSRNEGGNYASDKSHNAPTAYEAQVVKAASEIRVDERRDICADILVDVFEDMNTLVFEEWEDEQVVQVMGPEAVPFWVKFKPNMLKGARYELSIDPDSTLPETKDLRMQKADKVYTVLKQNPLIDPQLLTQYYLREMHGVQYDNLIRTVQQNAAAGVPGSTPDNPMVPGQMLQMMAQNPSQGGT